MRSIQRHRRTLGLTAVAVTALLLASCSSEEQVKQLGGGGGNSQTTLDGEETPATTASGDTAGGTSTTITGDGPPSHRLDPDAPPPPELASRPTELTSQEWWLRGDVMKWWFGEPATDAVRPETLISIWADPNNSDVGDPETARSLAEAGKNVTAEWLTTNPPGETRGLLPPAVNITFQGAAAAKAYRIDGGPQLYRDADLWSAEQDRDYQRPVYNQMLEMYFSDSPGTWTRVPCDEAGPSMCTPIFQNII